MLAPPGDAGEISGLLERLGRGERAEHVQAIRMVKDGQLVDVDVTLWPTRDLDGTITGASAIVRNISALKRAERELTQLYEQQRHVALTLQKALMGTPPRIPEIETAHRYLPATSGAGVGGDWFDLIPLGAGRAGVCVRGPPTGAAGHPRTWRRYRNPDRRSGQRAARRGPGPAPAGQFHGPRRIGPCAVHRRAGRNPRHRSGPADRQGRRRAAGRLRRRARPGQDRGPRDRQTARRDRRSSRRFHRRRDTTARPPAG